MIFNYLAVYSCQHNYLQSHNIKTLEQIVGKYIFCIFCIKEQSLNYGTVRSTQLGFVANCFCHESLELNIDVTTLYEDDFKTMLSFVLNEYLYLSLSILLYSIREMHQGCSCRPAVQCAERVRGQE